MRVVAVVVTFSFVAAAAVAQNSAVALDSDSHTLAFIDIGRAAVDSKVAVPLTALSRAVVSPDGHTILAINDGGLRSTGFLSVEVHPDKKGSYALATLDKVTGNGGLGWGIADAIFSADGKSAYVLTTGDDAKKPADLKASELIRIDAVTGAEAGRLSFARSASALGFDRSGQTAIVFSPMQTKRTPPLPARLTFVDAAALKEISSIDIPGKPERAVAVGDLYYFTDPGEKNAAGKVHVVDPAKRGIVKSIEVGSYATVGGSDRDGNLFVLGQSADRKIGQVTVIRGSDIAATYTTGVAPQKAMLSADGKRLYVTGGQLGVIDLTSKTSTPGIDAARPAIGILATRDGRRVMTSALDGASCCRISVFDTTANKQLTSFLGGSKGARIGQGLEAAALSVASYEAGRSGTRGGGTFYYSIYSPIIRGAARGPLAFGPGEKKLYAVDTQTNDVTVVDVETGQRTANINGGAGLKEVIPLPDANLIAAVSDERIDLIDTSSDAVRESIKMHGRVDGTVVSPDEKRLVVYGKDRIVVIDTATGKQVGTIDAFKSPSQIIFLK